jgi:serine/threonine protein phosphatase PrpC
METIQITGGSDAGLRRKDNQDTFICQQLWSAGDALLAVIDGVGGYAGGEIAAALAKESIIRYMASPKGDTLTMLREAVVFANNKIAEERKNDPRLSQMCCVLTAAVADARSQKLFFVHVGDTRLYRFRNGVLEKLTKDHSLVGIREDAGELTEKEAMTHPRRNEILREAGSTMHRIDDPDFIDYEETAFQPEDLLLICSDGLTDMITRQQMTTVLEKDISLEEKVAELIALANGQGGHDNITLVLAKNLTATVRRADSHNRIKTPSQLPVMTEVTDRPDSSSFPQQSSPVPFFQKYKWVILSALIILFLLATAVLWKGRKQPEDNHQSSKSPELTVNTSVQSPAEPAVIPSLAEAQRSPEKRWVLPADTIRLPDTIILEDRLTIIGATGRSIIMPVDSFRNQLAFQIKKNSKIVIENVVISGFETGISTEENVRLQLKGVQFKNVATPVKAGLKENSYTNEEIIFSSESKDSTVN